MLREGVPGNRCWSGVRLIPGGTFDAKKSVVGE